MSLRRVILPARFYFYIVILFPIKSIIIATVPFHSFAREREGGISKYLQSGPPRGDLYRASFASLNAADRERELLIGRSTKSGLISASGIARRGHKSATVRQEKVSNRPYCGTRRCLSQSTPCRLLFVFVRRLSLVCAAIGGLSFPTFNVAVSSFQARSWSSRKSSNKSKNSKMDKKG